MKLSPLQMWCEGHHRWSSLHMTWMECRKDDAHASRSTTHSQIQGHDRTREAASSCWSVSTVHILTSSVWRRRGRRRAGRPPPGGANNTSGESVGFILMDEHRSRTAPASSGGCQGG